MRAIRWFGGFCATVACALLVAGCGACGNCSGGGTNSTITSVSVAVNPSSITTAQTSQATATVQGTGSYSSAVTWSVSPSSMGTVSTTGVFTPATTGSATITATSVEDPTQSGSATVTVGAPAPTITSVTVTVNPSSITTAQTTQATATVQGTGAYSSAVTWSVSPSTMGTISSTGQFTPAMTGTATITATSTEDTTKSGSATVTVTTPPPTITSVSVMMSATSITTAQTSQGTATVTGTGAYSSGVTWSVSPSTIGSISSTGLFTPAATGTATITATSTEDATKSGSAQVTVNPVAAITSVTVSVNPTSINTSQTAQATATVQGVGAYSSTVTWSVSPSGIGSISNTGLFTPATTGTATITATSTEDSTKYGSAQLTVTAAPPTITGVTVTPSTATIGTTQQFTATVSGTGSYNHSVTWSVTGPSGWTGSIGSISSSGLYETPYPAPATVTVTATSVGDTSVSGSATVSLQPPATAAGPALTVDATDALHAINPLIYGMNGYVSSNTDITQGNVPLLRWGGDYTSRYNYQTNISNSASDWYFENSTSSGNQPGGGSFTGFVSAVHGLGAEPLGTVPVLGWVSNSNSSACSFPTTTYPGQQQVDPYHPCGNGVYPDGTHGCTSSSGCNIPGGAAEQALTSIAEPPPANSAATMPTASAATVAWAQGTWTGGWVNSLVTNPSYGPASGGKGVNIWDLDNEPAWWDAVHRDVHPAPSTYDEVTYGGISTALAIKTIDPSAQVSGPVIDYWWNYFYSKQDIENGWGHGPCYQPWSDPTDREAHGGVPMIEYYLQQFAAAQATYGMRLLDYVDIHGYYAATYNGASVGFATAGDTGEQEARINSTRALWDPTYTDPNEPQPNYPTDPNYTTSCNVPLQAPELIPMLRKWVANDYPGTKTAIDEYNWGGLESINGALTQADVLGIFGQYGLDMGALWGPPTASQVPGLMAFEIYRNYDGHDSTFGDTALASCSGTAAASCDATGTNAAEQNQLAVYGALRSSDNAVTVVVINKSYGALTSTLSLEGVTASGNAAVYQYSTANLNAIVAEPSQTVTPPSGGGTTSTISYTFPAQSITLFVIPQ